MNRKPYNIYEFILYKNRELERNFNATRRINVAEVAWFYRVTEETGKIMAALAVEDKILIKKRGLICGNIRCGRIIAVYNLTQSIPTRITCEICRMEDKVLHGFPSRYLQTVEFYLLAKTVNRTQLKIHLK